MTWHRMAMVLATSLVLGGCHVERAPSRSPHPQARDAAVYATVLNSLYPLRATDTTRVIALYENTVAIQREKAPESMWTELYTFPGIDSTTAADLESRSTTPFVIRSVGPALEQALAARVMFLADSDFTALHRRVSQRTDDPVRETTDEFWKAFYQAYPARWGSISVSAIGYRHDGGQAVLHVENGCGGLCGQGQIVLLEKVAGRWKIVRVKITFFS